MIPLQSKMPNGASVSDWLGTAGVAALAAASRIDLIRQQRTPDPLGDINTAIERLEDALEELNAVKKHAALVGQFGERQL